MYCKIEYMYMYRKCVKKRFLKKNLNFAKNSNDLRKLKGNIVWKYTQIKRQLSTHYIMAVNIKYIKQKLKPCSM